MQYIINNMKNKSTKRPNTSLHIGNDNDNDIDKLRGLSIRVLRNLKTKYQRIQSYMEEHNLTKASTLPRSMWPLDPYIPSEIEDDPDKKIIITLPEVTTKIIIIDNLIVKKKRNGMWGR